MPSGCCGFLQVAFTSAATCCNMATSDTACYAEITVGHFVLLPAALSTLLFTHHIFILANSVKS